MPPQLHVVVIGGGNSTPIFAALAKLAGHHVSILTRRPKDWSTTVGFNNEDPGYLGGVKQVLATVDCVTGEASKCIPSADVIFLAGVPIHHSEQILRDNVAPYMSRSKPIYVGSICAYGGFNWLAARVLGQGNYVLFGTQLIPWTCGTVEYGRLGVIFGAKRMLRIATEDGKDTQGVKPILARILQMPELVDTDFLACVLWPNNPSLHPPILIGLFEQWDGKSGFRREDLPVFIYKDLRSRSAKFLVDLDAELVALVAKLATAHPGNPYLRLNYSLGVCIKENYREQVLNTWDTVSCVSSCVAFGKHKIPYTELASGLVVPTLKHKFFETDLTHGLTTWKDLALMVNMDTPIIDLIIRWNQRLNSKEYLAFDGTLTGKDIGECVIPSRMGVRLSTLAQGNRAAGEGSKL